MTDRYWLRVRCFHWQEATLEQFIAAERGAGFKPKDGDGPATAGFSNSSVEGRVTSGEITIDMYPEEPDFVAAARRPSIVPATQPVS